MKVSELSGALLDYWVAKAEGIPTAWISRKEGEEPVCILGPVAMDRFEWSPSTSWAQGGPIIEREGIDITVAMESVTGEKTILFWSADRDDWDGACGETPLTAAMRAYVQSKFGAEVTDI